jgi:tetratricopeptide (TPR) repeat protein
MKVLVVGFLAVASLAMGQKVKSKNEQEAVKAVLDAQTPDAKIAAVEALLAKFKDTEFKSITLVMAAQAEQQKGDAANAIVYGNRALEADPKSYQAMLLVAGELAQGTKEFDLDKDEKEKRANKLASDAIAVIAAAPKPNPGLSDDQWNGAKKDMTAQAHETLGVIALVDKHYDVAINEFKTSADGAATPEATTLIRLTATYNNAKQYDLAASTADKVLAMPNVPDQFKKIALDEKQRATKMKAGQ